MIQQTDNADTGCIRWRSLMRNKVMKVNTGQECAIGSKGRGRCLFCICCYGRYHSVFFVAGEYRYSPCRGFAALHEWMYETRYGWLIWRCVSTAYSEGGDGKSGMHRASTGIQGTFSSYGHSQCFVCSVCEYSVFAGPGR